MSDFIAEYYAVDPSPLEAEFRIEQCNSCRTYYQAEVGGRELLDQIYDKWVDQIDDPNQIPSHADDMANPRLSRDGHEVMAAASYLGLQLDQLKTLDFGMGFGLWAASRR